VVCAVLCLVCYALCCGVVCCVVWCGVLRGAPLLLKSRSTHPQLTPQHLQPPPHPTPPHPTHPKGGPDVYEGVHIDYRGADVNADNFMAVLRGDAHRVAKVGSGRVLEAGPHDKVGGWVGGGGP